MAWTTTYLATQADSRRQVLTNEVGASQLVQAWERGGSLVTSY